MSAEKKWTDRDLILAKRQAFESGVNTLFLDPCIAASNVTNAAVARAEAKAKGLYPLPKVTRPRVVPDPLPGFDQSWRVVDGALQWSIRGEWTPLADTHVSRSNVAFPTPKRVLMWADLLTNPTELVEDES